MTPHDSPAWSTTTKALIGASAIVGNTFEAILRYGLERGQFPQAKGREPSASQLSGPR